MLQWVKYFFCVVHCEICTFGKKYMWLQGIEHKSAWSFVFCEKCKHSEVASLTEINWLLFAMNLGQIFSSLLTTENAVVTKRRIVVTETSEWRFWIWELRCEFQKRKCMMWWPKPAKRVKILSFLFCFVSKARMYEIGTGMQCMCESDRVLIQFPSPTAHPLWAFGLENVKAKQPVCPGTSLRCHGRMQHTGPSCLIQKSNTKWKSGKFKIKWAD